MNKNKLAALVAVSALITFFVGCNSKNSNANVSRPENSSEISAAPKTNKPVNFNVAGSKKEFAALNFDPTVAKDVEKAINVALTDPASATLTLKGILDNKNKPLDAKQIEWVKKQIEILQPQALAILEEDFNYAVQSKDLRGVFIIWTVANKISKDSVGSEDLIASTRKALLAEEQNSGYIWKISKTSVVPIVGNYTEDEGSSQKMTLTPKSDSHFLRVKAQVENISDQPDMPYTLWAFNDFKRSLSSLFSEKDQNNDTSPSHWLDDNFIVLVSSSEIYPSSLVVEGSVLREGSITITSPDGSGNIIAMPKSVKKGESIEIDMLFAVPKDSTGLKLLIFGASPVELGK